MKKRLFIIAISIAKFIITGSAQEFENTDTAKKQYKCFVSIKTINGDKIDAALSSFTADSILLAPLENKFVKAGGKYIKILQVDPDTAIAVDQVIELKIKYDPNIIYRDELVTRKKQLRQRNAGKIVEIVALTAATIALVPVDLATYGLVDATIPASLIVTSDGCKIATIPGNNLHLTSCYITFIINGDKDHYIRMVKRLTKSRSNPFENNLVKN